MFLLDEPFAVSTRCGGRPAGDYAGLSGRASAWITDHNVRDTLAITDFAYIINEGSVLASGTPREIADDPVVRKIYLGEKFRLE